MKVDDRLTIEREPDASLRQTEYAVVSFDQEGNEIQGLLFWVDRRGRIVRMVGPVNLIEGVDLVG